MQAFHALSAQQGNRQADLAENCGVTGAYCSRLTFGKPFIVTIWVCRRPSSIHGDRYSNLIDWATADGRRALAIDPRGACRFPHSVFHLL